MDNICSNSIENDYTCWLKGGILENPLVMIIKNWKKKLNFNQVEKGTNIIIFHSITKLDGANLIKIELYGCFAQN